MAGIGPLAAEWLAGGALIAFLGALIKFAGWTWLLAGYDKSTSTVPDEIVQEMAGNTLLRLGIALIVGGVIATVTTTPPYFEYILVSAIVLGVGRLIYRLNTWEPSRTA